MAGTCFVITFLDYFVNAETMTKALQLSRQARAKSTAGRLVEPLGGCGQG